MIPAHILDAIRRAVSVPDLVRESGIELRKQNGRFVGWCPFCIKPRTPAFYVYPDHAYCFRCETHLTCFDWLVKMESLTFREAVERLSERSGISLDGKRITRTQALGAAEDSEFFAWWKRRQQDIARRVLDHDLRSGPPDNREDYEFCESVGRLLQHDWTREEFRQMATAADRKAFRMDKQWDEGFAKAWLGLAK